MKAVILCGGKGTRMREETEYRPKPLVDIGGRPIIWHIMKIYSYYGIHDFVLCVGYKGYMIKQYFMDMIWRNNDLTIHTLRNKDIEIYSKEEENWNITIVDTGVETMTGGRIKKIKNYIDEEEFMLTYGDGLSDVNISELLSFHRKMGKAATITGVRTISPFGVMEVENGLVKTFKEKPILEGMVNGGYMVLNKKVFDYIPDVDCFFEQEPLRQLSVDGELAVFEHKGFWTAIDTFKDIERVNAIWDTDEKPWKVWN